MVNNEYFDKMELEDYSKLVDFNKSVKWFKEMERNTIMDRIDITAKDTKGRSVNVELKSRNIGIDQYDDLFIETDKYDNLIRKWKNLNEIPLYINFIGRTHIVMYDLRKIKDPTEKSVTIYNPGKMVVELVRRYMLPISDGLKYVLNENNDWVIMS